MAGRASPPLKAAGTLWLRLRAAAPSGSETASQGSLSISERVSPAHWLTERFCEIGSRIPAIRSHAAPLAPPLAQILFPSPSPQPPGQRHLPYATSQGRAFNVSTMALSCVAFSPSPRSLRTALSTLLASKLAHVEGSRFHWRFHWLWEPSVGFAAPRIYWLFFFLNPFPGNQRGSSIPLTLRPLKGQIKKKK